MHKLYILFLLHIEFSDRSSIHFVFPVCDFQRTFIYCRDMTKPLMGKGNPKLILLKLARFGTSIGVSTGCGCSLYCLYRLDSKLEFSLCDINVCSDSMIFQTMIIVAWSPSGSILAIFSEDVFKNVLTIFITSAFLNLLQGNF